MADRPAAGEGRTARGSRIGSIPALHLHYGHRLLAEIGRYGPISLKALLERFGDRELESLFKGERIHRSPLERSRQLMRYARELGLVAADGDRLSLTAAGQAYVRAGDPRDAFATTDEQREMLRSQLREGVVAGDAVPRGVALALQILSEEGSGEISPTALGERLAKRGHVHGWTQPRTFQAQGERYLALIHDARLLESTGALSGEAVELATLLDAGDAPRTDAPRGAGARAWIVRAGREGRYERLALSEGVCLIGWSELGPLAPGVTREQLKQHIERTYGEHRPRSLASQAGQVHRFLEEIALGDVVVLPLMSDDGHVAVGRVRGDYEYRDDGLFAGTDAQHTRRVEWLAPRLSYERFDVELRTAFGQQGTISQIGAPRAAERIVETVEQAMAIHLVLKWTKRLGADTIERHVEVAQQFGAVWWGRVSKPGATGLARRWVEQLRMQIEEGVPTSVFLRGATTWEGRLLAIATDRSEIEEGLVPSYYDPATHHSLWVKLTDLHEIEQSEISRTYVLENGGGPVTPRGLGNQTPMILRGPPSDAEEAVGLFAETSEPGPPRVSPAADDAPTPAPPTRQAPRGGASPPGKTTARPPRPARPLDLGTLLAAVERHELRLPERTLAHVLAVLRSDKHLVLTGPPGTAKTTLATAIAEAAAEVGLCAGHVPTTATADWTTNETIGGLRPAKSGELHFEEGHFVTAIRERHWLLIDELNRSQFDRAFGQLFTVLSGHRVVLPYHRPDGDPSIPLALVPHDVDDDERFDTIRIPASWRIVATMNVFDKTLLFDMSFALMRRFGFVEVGCPADEVFVELIERCTDGDARAARLAQQLLPLRRVKEVGPAVYMDLARFLRERVALDDADDGRLLFEAFYSYLLPQFEGVQGRDGDRLHELVSRLVGANHRERLRTTLTTVLGLDLPDPETTEPAYDEEEDGDAADTADAS